MADFDLVFDESGFFLLYATMLGIKGMRFYTFYIVQSMHLGP